eukprot:775338_1
MALWFVVSETAIDAAERMNTRSIQTRIFAQIDQHFNSTELLVEAAHGYSSILEKTDKTQRTLVRSGFLGGCDVFFQKLLTAHMSMLKVGPSSLFTVFHDGDVCGSFIENGQLKAIANRQVAGQECLVVQDSPKAIPACSTIKGAKWYKAAMEADGGSPVWTSGNASTTPGQTPLIVSQSLAKKNHGVIVAGISESIMSKFLKTLILDPEDGDFQDDTCAYVLENDSFTALVSSVSKLERDCGDRCILAEDEKDETLHSLFEFLACDDTPDLEEINEPVEVIREVFEYNTFIGRLGNSDSQWFAAVAVEKSDSVNHDQTFLFLITCGAVIILVITTTSQVTRWYSKAVAVDKQEDSSEAESLFGGITISEESMGELRAHVGPEVLRSVRASWRRENPLHEEPSAEYLGLRALEHIQAAADHGINLLRYILLDRDDLNNTACQVYMLLSNSIYQMSVKVLLFLYMVLVFHEPLSNDALAEANGLAYWLMLALHFVALFAQIFDMAAKCYVKYVEFRVEKEIYAEKIEEYNAAKEAAGDDAEIELEPPRELLVNFLSDKSAWNVYVVHGFILALLFIDFVLRAFFRWSFNYYVPVRPLLLVVASRRVRATLDLFLKTLWKAIDVLLLLFASLIVTSVFGVAMFSGRLNTDEVSHSYDDFVSSFLTSTVYFITSENYPDLVFPGYVLEPVSGIYWVITTVFVSFFMTGMVAGYFGDVFTELQKTDLIQRKLYTRSSLVCAFVLLDQSGDGTIDLTEFETFMMNFREDLSPEAIREIFDSLDKDTTDNSQTLSPAEFVFGMEEVSLNKRLAQYDVESESRFFKVARKMLFENKVSQQIDRMLILVNIMVLALYSSRSDSTGLDIIALCFLIFFAVEVGLRVLMYGWRRFWNWGVYHDPGLFQMYTNRAEVGLVLLTLGLLIYDVAEYPTGIMFPSPPSTRMILCMPILRVFTRFKRLRHLLFSLFQILPQFTAVFTLLFAVLLFYGIIGITMFDGVFVSLNEGIPVWDFASMGNVMLLLLMCITGESWDAAMFDTISATGYWAAFYYVSFCLLIHLLMADLFIGLVLSVYALIVDGSDRDEINQKQIDRIIEKDMEG